MFKCNQTYRNEEFSHHTASPYTCSKYPPNPMWNTSKHLSAIRTLTSGIQVKLQRYALQECWKYFTQHNWKETTKLHINTLLRTSMSSSAQKTPLHGSILLHNIQCKSIKNKFLWYAKTSQECWEQFVVEDKWRK